MKRTRLATLLVLALAWSTCGSGSGPQSVLPGSNAVDSWKLTEDPIVVDTEVGLYQMIDGGAPKYTDHGWVSSAYALYQKDSRSIQIQVDDMGSLENAETMFDHYLPYARIEISYTSESDPGGRRPNAVLSELQGTYFASAFSNRYYIEICIDAKTDAAQADIKAFVLEMLDRAQ